MCYLYPAFSSCFGIRLRIGLLYIAILSIVISFEDSGGTDNDPPPKSEGSNASGGTDDDPPPKPEGSNESGGTDDDPPPKPEGSNESGGTDNDPPPKPEGSNESGGTDNDPPPKPEGSKEDGDAKSSKESDVSEGSKKPGDPKGSKEPGDPKGSKESEDPDGSKDSDDANPTETTRVTTTTPPGPSTTKEELFTEVMGKVNRNGLSFLSITFIFLGIILLIANFVNSPELALIYVWLLVSTIIASLVILAATVGECTLAPHSCLLSKLDDFTGTMICLFWLLYISAWTHFAAVANGMARQVTGALINAAIKKAGVDVSHINDVMELLNTTAATTKMTTTVIETEDTDLTGEDLIALNEVPRAKARRRMGTAEPWLTTVEIIGEDGRLQVISFEEETETDDDDPPPPPPPPPPAAESNVAESSKESKVAEVDEGSGEEATTKGAGAKIKSKHRTTPAGPSTPKKDVYTAAMGKVNRNGLNFLAMLFIALGIILLIANFVNSPEMALLYVALLISTCIASLVLLTSVVGECARAHDTCLLAKLDWFTGFVLTLFWFVYIFVWAFFAAVANGMAREVP
ncbi:uncharacterized protein LOC125238615 isoform X2 [Leguminivora glycinivorella]|uniref:uncharacterized protein LOC125238615 isoform X2 n=1 Tax=Leguminivora glycinivorella TaxID=1035111 RepID=UPI00201050CA|nr:uncharacterized protein LOC125238615 isoform X2 [Leguminivora glycinivorella]